MLSVEVAEFYGVKDAAMCADFVTFINGMLGFVETNRRECWGQLCVGLINVQTKLKALQSTHTELEAKYEALSRNFDDVSEKYKKSVALTDRLHQSNKEFKIQIESLKSQTSLGGKTAVSEPSGDALQIETIKPQSGSKQSFADAARAKRSVPEPSSVPESDEEECRPAPAKKDKVTIIIELRKRVETLVAENERLDRLLSVLKKPEAVSVDTAKRISQEEGVRLRRANMELESKLAALREESRLQVFQHTERIKANNAEWERQRDEWIKSNTSILLPSSFSLLGGEIMACPVPIRTGRLVPLLDIYQSWVRYPADNEGTFFTSILCPYSSQLTTLASVEQVNLIHSIATELRLFMIPPLRFQHFLNGSWVDFTFIDQISIAAMCCKHYRLGTTRIAEKVMVGQGDFIFNIHISDNVVDFQLQPVHNTSRVSPACLLTGVANFFQRWTFPTGGEGNDAPASGQ